MVRDEWDDLECRTVHGSGNRWDVHRESDQRCRHDEDIFRDGDSDGSAAAGVGVAQSNFGVIADRRDSAIHGNCNGDDEHSSNLVSDWWHDLEFRVIYSPEYRRHLHGTSNKRCGYDEDGFCQCHCYRASSCNCDQSNIGILADGRDAAVRSNSYGNDKYSGNVVRDWRHGVQFWPVYSVQIHQVPIRSQSRALPTIRSLPRQA